MQSKDDLSARKKTIRTTLVKSASDVNALSESLNYRKLAVESSIASFAASSKLFEINRGNLTDFQRVEDDLNDKVRQLIDNWFDLSIAYYRHLHVSDSLKSQFLSPHKAQPQSSGLPL
jgi:outer membrane protein TolC